MSMLQPNTPERTHRFQVFAILFDHTNGIVSVDCVDPADAVPGGPVLNRRYDIPARLNEEVIEKVAAILDAADCMACAAEDGLP